MTRRSLNFLSALSTAFATLTVALWVRSYLVQDHLRRGSCTRTELSSNAGWVSAEQSRSSCGTGGGPAEPDAWCYEPGPAHPWSQTPRAELSRHDFGWKVVVPSWLLAGGAALPAVVIIGGRHPLRFAARRRRRGLCRRCGYDLRATPARCPECGAKAATAG